MIYEPAEDSYLLEKQVKKYAKGKRVLDMGAGSGIQAIAARDSGARSVLAADINPESVFLLKSKGIDSVLSNLFSNISEKFDLIIFNPPYLPIHPGEDKESQLITSGGKRGDEILLRFLDSVLAHLNSNGTVLIVVSSLTPQPRLMKKIAALNLKKIVLAKENLFMESLEVWKLSA